VEYRQRVRTQVDSVDKNQLPKIYRHTRESNPARRAPQRHRPHSQL